jgi:hypothetical protein
MVIFILAFIKIAKTGQKMWVVRAFFLALGW